jgi:hypothetical protein
MTIDRTRYAPDTGRSFSTLSMAGFALGLAGMAIGSIALGVATTTRSDISEISRQLRTAQTAIAALELEQRQLNDRIGEATQASEIARAILELNESR